MVRAWITLGLLLTTPLLADVGRSPFLPPSAPAGGAQPGTDPNQVELRGIMSTGQGPKYNIYDPAHKTSVWVGVDETGQGFIVKSGDPSAGTATVSANGQIVTLSLKQGKTQGGMSAVPGLPPGGVVLRPTQADEQARLQAVADEVRRRRLLRQQAEAQQQNGQPGVPVGAQNNLQNPNLPRRERPQP